MRQVFLGTFLVFIAFVAQAGKVRLPLAQSDMPAKRMVVNGRLPLSFESNRGQVGKSVKFLSRGPGYTLFLTPGEAVLNLQKLHAQPTTDLTTARLPQKPAMPPLVPAHPAADMALRIRVAGAKANPGPAIEGLNRLPGKTHYLIGKDPAKWRTDISNYGKVRYRSVYPGIDLVYYGKQRQLEYDFIVQPGADPKDILMAFSGAEGARIDSTGDLQLATAGGELRLQKPTIYQIIDGQQHNVEGRFVLHEAKVGSQTAQVGFQVAAYDKAQPLVIDPVLSYATFLGGSNDENDSGNGGRSLCRSDPFSQVGSSNVGIAVDAAGNTLVVGQTQNYSASISEFPLVDPLYERDKESGPDAFIAKISADGSQLLYSTYLGGDNADLATAIALDKTGNIVVTGLTHSSDFPVADTLFSAKSGPGTFDAFVAKISADGSQLLYSTYLGGTDNDAGLAVTADSAGNAMVTGATFSADFPVANPLSTNNHLGDQLPESDAFVTKLSADGTQLLYSTYLGGKNGNDVGCAIAVDSSDNALVTGIANSGDFPTVNARYPNYLGPTTQDMPGRVTITHDAFVSKISSAGTQLLFSTYLGGAGSDFARGIAVDSADNAVVAGETYSTDFPAVNALYAQPLDNHSRAYPTADAFVTKFNASGSELLYSTLLGGGDEDAIHGVAVDITGDAVVVGETASSDFPIKNGKYAAFVNNRSPFPIHDAFVSKLSADGSRLVYSTYLGGSKDDRGRAVALDNEGNAVLAGLTYSADFPMAKGRFLQLNNGGYESPNSRGDKNISHEFSDVFVAAKLEIDACASACLTIQSPAGGEVWNGGDKKIIRWSAQNIDNNEKVILYFSANDGATWKTLGSSRNTGYKQWKIPKKGSATQQGRLKICLKSAPSYCAISHEVFTLNQAPVAEAGKSFKVTAGTTVTLDGNSSYDPDSGPSPLSYQWSPLKGGALTGDHSPTPSFKTNNRGTYVFELMTYDGGTYSKPDKVKVVVVNKKPVANAGQDQTVLVGTTVQLDGSLSYDPDNAPLPLKYGWSILKADGSELKPDGSEGYLLDDTTATPRFVTLVAGTYFIHLTVFDGGASQDYAVEDYGKDKVRIVVK